MSQCFLWLNTFFILTVILRGDRWNSKKKKKKNDSTQRTGGVYSLKVDLGSVSVNTSGLSWCYSVVWLSLMWGCGCLGSVFIILLLLDFDWVSADCLQRDRRGGDSSEVVTVWFVMKELLLILLCHACFVCLCPRGLLDFALSFLFLTTRTMRALWMLPPLLLLLHCHMFIRIQDPNCSLISCIPNLQRHLQLTQKLCGGKTAVRQSGVWLNSRTIKMLVTSWTGSSAT